MSLLITGGAGFLGRAIIADEQMRKEHAFTVFSRDEHKHWLLREQYPEVQFALGDVRSLDRLRATMDNGITGVIHAAAQKFVPEGESNAIEFCETNVGGTIEVGTAAGLAGLQYAILISTDKAVNPVSNYGATKMMAERIWLELAHRFTRTRYIVVRYGNVIGSTGSVVELFRKQIDNGDTIRVTSLGATRFWMTPAEAVQVIRDAITAGTNDGPPPLGRIYIPNRLVSATMATLLEAMGVTKWIETGLRPGEKMHETLLGDHERSSAYFVGPYVAISQERLNPDLRVMDSYTITSDSVRQLQPVELRDRLP